MDSVFDYPSIIKDIGRGAKGARSMDATQAEWLFGRILDGQVPDLELGAIVMALRVKSESCDELLGFKRAMDERGRQLALPPGPRCVILPSYNGARRQANLVPLLALLLVRQGVPVLIQGRHDFTQRSDPFALLAALDIPTETQADAAAARLAAQGLASVTLHALLPGLDDLLALRQRFGVRGCGHTMAKLLDPCHGRSVRVVAVTHPEYLERMQEFLLADQGRAMLLRGTEGEAFANPRRRPQMMVFDNGIASVACAAAEGGAPPLAGLPDAPEVAANAALIRAMLAGDTAIPQPVLDQVDALAQLARQP